VYRLLLVRHGQSTWNAEHRWQGWADPPLSPAGIAQASAAAQSLARGDHGIVAVASSDLERARHTAELLAGPLGITTVTTERRLRERDVGDWSGHTAAEIEQRWPGMVAAWRRGEVPNPPNGERDDALLMRVLAGLAAVAPLAGDAGGALLVITHGGVIRILERHAGVRGATSVNLAGRWFRWHPETLEAGEQVALGDPDTPAIAPVF
jgi:ribonuclease H / adenosylcobalamin/alpha-ribazole phosphatase